MKDKLRDIIKKIGFNPITIKRQESNSNSWLNDDTEKETPYDKLTKEELDYIVEERLKYIERQEKIDIR